MKAHQEVTIEDAWLQACDHLLRQPGREQHHLVFEVTAPCAEPAEWQFALREQLDAFVEQHAKLESQPVQTVAETIFPAVLYQRFGSHGVYETYPNEVYPDIKGSYWGRYAYLLVRRLDSKGNVACDEAGVPINPLKRCVERMKKQIATHGNRVIYEMDFVDDLMGEIQFNRMALREPNPASGPCLSHISLKFDSARKKVYLAAVYRSHFYVQKALGNLLGLARLLAFVCNETGLEPGSLLCVSTHARLEFPQYITGVRKFEKMIDSLNIQRGVR